MNKNHSLYRVGADYDIPFKKIIRKMKITLFVVLISAIQVFAKDAYSQNKHFSLKKENTAIENILGVIESQSEFYFLYNGKLVDVTQKVNINIEKQDLEKTLNEIFKSTNIDYRIYDRQIVLSPKTTTDLSPQQKSVSGKVTDNSGAPLPGASVVVKGTRTGVITDANGNYSLSNIPENAILQFSFVGMKGQEITVKSQSQINITLAEEIVGIDEVVAIGYGTVKKRDLTGSVASIKSSEITKTASNNALQSMQGKIAGLDLTKNSGAAGTGLSINLRGNRSISASNSPLFLVDGLDYGSTLDINASDIESIEVLKDASSTAIYGTRGANGVIIITTKKGAFNKTGGKTKIFVNTYMSFNSATDLPRKMNAQQEYIFMAESQRYNAEKGTKAWGTTKLSDYPPELILSNVVSSPYTKSVYQIYKEGGINPFDLVLHNSISTNSEVSVSGGDAKTSFNISLGYMDENGLLHNNELKRYNARISLDHNISNTIKAGLNLQYTKRNLDQRNDNMYYYAMVMYSISQIRLPDGSLLDRPSELGRSYTNPLINELPGYYVDNTKNSRLFANMYLEWEIVKGLNFRSVFGIDDQSERRGQYGDFMTAASFQIGTGSSMSASNSLTNNYINENTLTYSVPLGSKHQLQLLAGQSNRQNVTEYHAVSGLASADHYTTSSFYDLTYIPTTGRTINNSYTKSSMLSYFGRANYKLMGKYLLTATIRDDGSSVLAEGHKWASFPSLASAWIISEEPFLKNVDNIGNLKLRLSWGKAGNAAIDPYRTLTVLGMTKVPYTFGTNVLQGQVPSNLGNKDLGWEITSQYDAGLDISILKNRISGTFDFYSSKTSDLLLLRGFPATSVYPQVFQNIGNTENRGFEAAMNFRIIDKKDFSWSSDLIFSMNRDKIVSLASGATQDVSIPTAALKVGDPVFQFYDFQSDGCWKISEAADAAKFNKVPGDVKFKDFNTDGKIDNLDKRFYNKSPKFVAGWNNTVSYKGISLSASAYARVGQWVSSDINTLYLPVQPGGQPVLDYWTPENQDAKFPRPGIDSKVDLPSLVYEKASFLKINQIILGYTLPVETISKIGLSNLKVYGELQNFFSFSNMKNYDPERGGSFKDPLMKQVVFGINLEF